MLARSMLQICLTALVAFGSERVICAQVRDRDPNSMMTPEYTASIVGRVVLPSGGSLSSNVKLTLSYEQSPLEVRFTDKHGEFRFLNVREGTYHIKVNADETLYEPVIQDVRVPRGTNVNVTIYLREKNQLSFRSSGSGVVSVADRNAPPQAKKAYEKALGLMGKGDPQQIIEYLKRAIAVYPDYLLARNDLGVQYLRLKQFDRAAEQFELAVKRDPKYFDARLNLGLVFVEQKKYGAAIDQFNQAISIDGARPAAHLWLGIAFLQINQLSGAERELMKTLMIGDADFPIAHYYLAHLRLRKGERKEAIYELKGYLQSAPNGEQSSDARRLLEKLQSSN